MRNFPYPLEAATKQWVEGKTEVWMHVGMLTQNNNSNNKVELVNQFIVPQYSRFKFTFDYLKIELNSSQKYDYIYFENGSKNNIIEYTLNGSNYAIPSSGAEINFQNSFSFYSELTSLYNPGSQGFRVISYSRHVGVTDYSYYPLYAKNINGDEIITKMYYYSNTTPYADFKCNVYVAK